jgi:pilus assembly protein CpaB
MNRKIVTILVTALLVASVSAFLVLHLVRITLAAAHRPSGAGVVAAKANVKLGTILSSADLTTIEISGTLPQGAIQDPKNAIGRGVISDLYQGEPILESRLAAVGSGGGLAPAIPVGMRACAVKVDEVVGVSGFVTPGMHVDVIVSGTPPGATNTTDGTEVRTALQNLQVLSAGTDIEKDAAGKAKPVQVVNLLVSPEQAETLSLVSNQTRIQLVLRNPLDMQIAQVPGNALGSVFAGGRPKPVVAVHRVVKSEASAVYTVEVMNGSKGSVEKFATSEGK